MVTRSGTVYDIATSGTISGAEIYVLKVSGTELHDSTTSSGNGTFSIDVDPSQDVLYLPFKQGYRGYKAIRPSAEDDLSLYLSSGTGGIPQSGNVFTSLVDACILTSNNVVDLTGTPCSLYAITDSGVDIIKKDGFINQGYAVLNSGISAIDVYRGGCDTVRVLLGYTPSGVLGFEYSASSGNVGDFYNELETITSSGLLSNPNIYCIHSSQDQDEFSVGTSGGIDFVSDLGVVYSHLITEGVTSCFLTPSGDLYYSPTESGMYVKYGPIISSWSSPDYILNSGTTPAFSGNRINDIEVVNVSGINHVFMATNSGIGVYREKRNAISGSQLKWFTSTLSGIAEEFTGLEVLPGSSISGGVIYGSSLVSGIQSLEDIEGGPNVKSDFTAVQSLSMESNSVLITYNDADIDIKLRRNDLALLGSKFLHVG